MEKERGAKVIAIVALLIAVVGLTVGYAAYSSTLTINGTANVDPASWKVNFDYKTGTSLTGKANGHAAENTAPTLADTTISGFDVTLKAPGDSVTYNFLIKNSETLNANDSKELELKLEWPSTSTLSITDDVKVTIGATTFVYEQA